MNKNWLKYLVALSAILIAGSAAYFSVTGLGVLFSGAAVAVMVMAGSLEFAKLVTATYLKQEWDSIKGLNKWYLTSAVVILMAITSAGIFGYLSNAFQQQNLKLEQIQREIDVWNNKIKTDTAQITLYTNQLNQLQSNNNAVLSSNTNRSGLRFASSTSREQSKIRAKISALNDSVVVYNGKINDIKNANIGTEREVGGFRFVAESFGVPLNTVVKFFIILIVIVFDPLAVALIISFNQLTMVPKKEEEDEVVEKEEHHDEPKSFTQEAELKDFIDETTKIHLSEDDIKKLEEVLINPPKPNENLISAAKKHSEIFSNTTEESTPNNPIDIVDELNNYFTNTPKEEIDELVNKISNMGDASLEATFNAPLEIEENEFVLSNVSERFDYVEENFSTIEPTEEEERRNFSTIEPIEEEDGGIFSTNESNLENFFQDNEDWTPETEEQYWENESNKYIPSSDINQILNNVQTETFSQEPIKLEIPDIAENVEAYVQLPEEDYEIDVHLINQSLEEANTQIDQELSSEDEDKKKSTNDNPRGYTVTVHGKNRGGSNIKFTRI